MKKSLFLAVGALSLWMGVARADGNAELIQRSYDSEATGQMCIRDSRCAGRWRGWTGRRSRYEKADADR